VVAKRRECALKTSRLIGAKDGTTKVTNGTGGLLEKGVGTNPVVFVSKNVDGEIENRKKSGNLGGLYRDVGK